MLTNLRHLAYVVAAADTSSITLAAKKVLISQPAISAAIKGCEDEFGISIFVRKPAKGLSLTPAGRAFVRRARVLLEDAEEFHREFAGYGERLSGRLELACYTFSAPFFLPPVVRTFEKHYPDVSIGIHEGDMEEVVQMLRDGVADIGLSYDLYPDEDVEFERIAGLKPWAVMSARNPLARESDISLEVLAEQPMVVLDTPGNREYVRNYFAMHGLEPRVRHKTKTYEMARGLISTGNSYTFGFVPLKNRQTYDGSKVSYLRVKEQAPDAHIGIVMSKNCRPSRIARAFREECRRQLGSIANWETRRRTGRAGGRARA